MIVLRQKEFTSGYIQPGDVKLLAPFLEKCSPARMRAIANTHALKAKKAFHTGKKKVVSKVLGKTKNGVKAAKKSRDKIKEIDDALLPKNVIKDAVNNNLEVRAEKAKKIAKDIYNNTGDVIDSSLPKVVGSFSGNPGAAGEVLAWQAGASALNIAPLIPSSTALQSALGTAAIVSDAPVTAKQFKAISKLRKPYKELSDSSKGRFKKGYKLTKKLTKKLQGKSVKGAVDSMSNVPKKIAKGTSKVLDAATRNIPENLIYV